MRLVQQIPSAGAVKDPLIRRIFDAITANLNAMGGVGIREDDDAADDRRVIDRGDLRGIGLIGVGPRRQLYAKRLRKEQEMVDQADQPYDGGYIGYIVGVFEVTASTPAGTYDFIADDGSVLVLPEDAYVERSWYENLVAFAGVAGTTLQIDIAVDDVAGILPAGDISTSGAAGVHQAIQDGQVANFSVKTTAARAIQIVTSNTLTAGKLRLFLQYAISS